MRSGKVRYFGLSDTPAWYLARAATMAELRGTERVVALQLEYSLVERNIEHEHVPAALELGMGICPWSPLASGLLTGKYKRDGVKAKGGGRLETLLDSGNPAFTKLLTERNWRIVDTLVDVAREMGSTPASVALAWITRRPGVASTIIGATKSISSKPTCAHWSWTFLLPSPPSSRKRAARKKFSPTTSSSQPCVRCSRGLPRSAQSPLVVETGVN